MTLLARRATQWSPDIKCDACGIVSTPETVASFLAIPVPYAVCSIPKEPTRHACSFLCANIELRRMTEEFRRSAPVSQKLFVGKPTP
jgi:hypothetical protein